MGSTWKKVALVTTALIVACSAWITWNQVFEVEAEPRLTYKHMDGEASSSNFLLEIPIYGEIMVDAADPSLFWSNEATYSTHIQKLLQQASQDPRVKGILLRINTGGGSFTGSEAIYRALVNYRKTTKNPVVAYIEEIAASGGVMSMMGADAVYAAPGSDIGSIGVVGWNWIVFDKPTSYTDSSGGSISKDDGLERIVISAGKGKDLGHVFRKPTDAEMKAMRKSINNQYDDFVDIVSKSRGIPEKIIREEMGAYLFDDKQAQKLKLIDGTKSRDEAIAALANRAKLGDDFRLVRAKAPTDSFAWLPGSAQALTYDQKMQMLNRDRCSTARSGTLLYHGSMKNLCSPDN